MQRNLRLNSRVTLRSLVIALFSIMIGTLIHATGVLAQGGLPMREAPMPPSACVGVEPGKGTIQTALGAARQAGTSCLQLKEGEYAGGILITDQIVEIRGAPFSEKESPKSIIKGSVYIMWSEYFAKESAPESTVTLKNVKVSSADTSYLRYGISLGNFARISLVDATVSGDVNGIANGIVAFGSSVVTLTNSTVSKNGWAGISVSGSSVVTLTSSTVSGNWGDGIEVSGSNNVVTLTNSTVSGISGNGSNGISTKGSNATVTLTNSIVSGNENEGIFAVNSNTVTLTNSTVSGNGVGIELNSGSVTLTSSTVSGNEYYGILAVGSSTVTLTNSKVEDNGSAVGCHQQTTYVCGGVEVYNSTAVIIRGTTITGNTRWGVAVGLKKCGEVVDMEFTGTVKLKEGNTIQGNHAISAISPDSRGGGDLCLPDATTK